MSFEERKHEMNRSLDKYLDGRKDHQTRFIGLSTTKKSVKPQTEKQTQTGGKNMTKTDIPQEEVMRVIQQNAIKRNEEKKTQSVSSSLLKSKKPIAAVKSSVPDDQVEEEFGEVEEIEGASKPGFFSRVKSFFGFGSIPPSDEEIDEHDQAVSDVIDEEKEALLKDMRRVLSITHHYLERLPTRIKDEFKETEDYQTYVNTLIKYGLAKHKDED